jgi:hypothetical protein
MALGSPTLLVTAKSPTLIVGAIEEFFTFKASPPATIGTAAAAIAKANTAMISTPASAAK